MVPELILRYASVMRLRSEITASVFALCFLFASGVWAGSKSSPKAKKTKPGLGPVYKVPVDLKRDAFKGNPTALVTWVIFCDLQGPFCARYRRSVGKAREFFGADLRIVFKHRPLSWHRHAYRNAEAAQCANEHDMFWEFHDWMVERRSDKEQAPQKIPGHARSAGLAGKALDAFVKCFTSRRYDQHVADDLALAERVGARGIPYSYINGRLVRGAVRYETIRAVIDRELTAARKLAQNKKLRDDQVYDSIIAGGQYYSRLAKKVENLSGQGAPVLGNPKSAKHVLTTFIDLRSIASRKSVELLIELQQKNPAEVALVGRHYPMGRRGLRQSSHQAAACAQAQGVFWPFVKQYLRAPRSHQGSDASFWRLLSKRAAVKSAQGFDLCITNAGASELVSKDIALARKLKTSSASVFVNGRRWGGTIEQLLEFLYPDAKRSTKPTSDTRLREAKKGCESSPKSGCRVYARVLSRFGPPTKRWGLRNQALAKACAAEDYRACRLLASSIAEGNGLAFNREAVRELRARVCKLTKGKVDCPPKPKKPKRDPRMDFFNPGVR